ncbi:MAG: tetratricopeptide repeat protein [Saprospiraceae bacterium]|nr:tetratricopeptide repeat protein [Saprospiraceae bacterium]
MGINELNISDSLLQLTLKIQKDNGFNDLKLKINTLISLSLLQNSFGNNSKSNELLLSAKTDFNNLDLSEPLSEYFYCKNYPILLSNLGHSFQKIGDNKNAKIYLIDALDILSNTCKNQDKDKIFCLNNLAILDYGNESGLNYLLKAKDIAEKMDQKPKLLFTIYSNLGEFYRLRNRFYQSEEYFLKALKIVERRY